MGFPTSSSFFWLISAAAGVVCVVTSDLTWIAFVPYLRFAWPVAESGVWLRARDPNRRRGATCFWLYLAFAGAVAAFKALVLLLVLIAVANETGRMPPLQTLNHILVVLIGGWGISCVFGWVGVLLSLSRRIPVFIIPNLKQLCEGDFDNLRSLPIRIDRPNGAIIIVTLALAAPFLSLSVGLLLYGARFQGELGRKFAVGGFVSMLASIVALIFAVAVVSRRVVAANPAQTWPECLVSSTLGQEPKARAVRKDGTATGSTRRPG